MNYWGSLLRWGLLWITGFPRARHVGSSTAGRFVIVDPSIV